MKKIFSLLAGVMLLLSFGCASTGNNDAASTVSTVVVYNTAYQILRKNPNHRAEFQKAAEDLRKVGNSGSIDAAALLAVLNRLNSNENLKPVVTSAAILAQSYVSVPVTPEVQARLKTIANAVAFGIELALNDAR